MAAPSVDTMKERRYRDNRTHTRLKHNTIMKAIFNLSFALTLLVFFLGTTTIYAQEKILVKPTKPQKQTTTTTTTKPNKTNTTTTTKPNKTSSNSQTNSSSQSSQTSSNSETSSSSTTTTPAPKPTTGTINGHEYVDLGLSVKWATCNVGASSPSDYGNYYAWGETTTKSNYSNSNSVTYGKSMGSIAGNPTYDAARANWGSTWRLPTANEIDELLNKCTWTWTSQGGHNGYKVKGPNGNSIFLPAAGWRYGTSLYGAGETGYSWSATPYEDDTSRAYCLGFSSGDHRRYWYDRSIGRSVRPVSE